MPRCLTTHRKKGERRSMRIRLALLLASAFVFIVSGAVACGGGEEESQPAPEEEKKEEEKKEVKKEEKKLEVKAPEEEKKKEEVKEPKVGGPVQKFEDLPEEVKEKLPEEAKQEIKQDLPEKRRSSSNSSLSLTPRREGPGSYRRKDPGPLPTRPYFYARPCARETPASQACH